MSISAQQLAKMLEKGNAKIVGESKISGNGKSILKQSPIWGKKEKIPRPAPKGLVFIKNTLLLMKVEFVTEHVFDAEKKRKFRFDVAILNDKIAIEYEGIFNTEFSRHTNVQGYLRDTEKYNLATIQGWRVLRYTGNGYEQFSKDIQSLLKL